MHLSTIVKVILVIVLVGLSFYGGVLYGSRGRGNSSNIVPNIINHHFAIGLVVYINPTAITITNEDNTYTKTFAITKKTIFSINGTKANASQIRAGYRVLIRESRKDPSKAGIVIANSNFSG
jgi:hypothetical protein